MENATLSTKFLPFGEEESQIFPGLSKAEEVIVWAGIVVGILGFSAILLRLTMPLVRKSCRKGKGSSKTSVNGTGQLIGSSTPSSSSRASTLSRSSQLDDLKSNDDMTSVTTISGGQDFTKPSLYRYTPRGNLSGLQVYPSQTKSENSEPRPASSQQKLNEELSSVLSTPTFQRLQSLNLSDEYRTNWDRTFNPSVSQSNGLSHHNHPSENRQVPETAGLRVHRSETSPRSQPELKTRF